MVKFDKVTRDCETCPQCPATSRPADFPSPPSRFVRRSSASNIKIELSPKISYNRFSYNKMIGEIVSLEMEGNCEDLPDLADLGYTPEYLAQIFGMPDQ